MDDAIVRGAALTTGGAWARGPFWGRFFPPTVLRRAPPTVPRRAPLRAQGRDARGAQHGEGWGEGWRGAQAGRGRGGGSQHGGGRGRGLAGGSLKRESRWGADAARRGAQVLRDASDEMACTCLESFAPVAPIIKYRLPASPLGSRAPCRPARCAHGAAGACACGRWSEPCQCKRRACVRLLSHFGCSNGTDCAAETAPTSTPDSRRRQRPWPLPTTPPRGSQPTSTPATSPRPGAWRRCPRAAPRRPAPPRAVPPRRPRLIVHGPDVFGAVACATPSRAAPRRAARGA